MEGPEPKPNQVPQQQQQNYFPRVGLLHYTSYFRGVIVYPKNIYTMEAPNSRPQFLKQEEGEWNWYPAPNALGNRMLRARARGLQAKRRRNGSQLRNAMRYYLANFVIQNKHERFVQLAHGVQFDFKMYKRVGRTKKKKVLQIEQ